MRYNSNNEVKNFTINLKEISTYIFKNKYIFIVFILLGAISGYGLSLISKTTYTETLQIRLPAYSSGVMNNTIALMIKTPGFILADNNNDNNDNNDDKVAIEARMIHDTSILQINISGHNSEVVDKFVADNSKALITKIENITNEAFLVELEKYKLMGGTLSNKNNLMNKSILVSPEIVSIQKNIQQVNKIKKMILGGAIGFLLAVMFLYIKHSKMLRMK